MYIFAFTGPQLKIIMQARVILITLLFFAALHMSSCFLKPKVHFNDHRGVYKDKGVTKDQLVYLEERKQRLHPKKYHRKSVKQAKREDRKEKKDALAKSSYVPPVDTINHNNISQTIPAIQSPMPDTGHHVAPSIQSEPTTTPIIGPDQSAPAGQPLQPDPAVKKEKKKHKKSKQKDAQQQ